MINRLLRGQNFPMGGGRIDWLTCHRWGMSNANQVRSETRILARMDKSRREA
jgi:hypothetical protein